MDEELKIRFFQLKLKQLFEDNTKPFPTMIFEMERPKIIELVRKFVMICPNFTPFSAENIKPMVKEGLEKQKVVDYGDLYTEVFLN